MSSCVSCSLRNLQADEWGSVVTVVSSDMREWQAPEQVSLVCVCMCVCVCVCVYVCVKSVYLHYVGRYSC